MGQSEALEDISDLINPGSPYGQPGYIGDIEELREYPCNCRYCRGLPMIDEADDG